MKFSVTAALLTFAASAYAQATTAALSVINPTYGVVWNAGETHQITWTVGDASVTTIQSISLRKGISTNLEKVLDITTTPFPATDLQYNWAIPATVASDSSYSVEVIYNGGSQYSPQFTIMALAPGVTPSTNASTVPSGSAPAGSGASSKPSSSSSASAAGNDDEGAASALKAGSVLGAVAVGVAGALLL